MLGTYFAIVLAAFVVMIVGAVLGYTTDFDKAIKNPLQDSLKKYVDAPEDTMTEVQKTYKAAWNQAQQDVSKMIIKREMSSRKVGSQ